MIEDRYLGDGVNASFDGYNVILDLQEQDTTIVLEPKVLEAFNAFQRSVESFKALKLIDERHEKIKKVTANIDGETLNSLFRELGRKEKRNED